MDTTIEPGTSQCCGTTTSVVEPDSPMLGAEEQVSSGVVRLKLNKPQRDKKVKWSNDTIDNEHLGRKKSKCCCVYVPPKAFDVSSDESDMECEHCSGHVEKRNKEPPPNIKKNDEQENSGE